MLRYLPDEYLYGVPKSVLDFFAVPFAAAWLVPWTIDGDGREIYPSPNSTLSYEGECHLRVPSHQPPDISTLSSRAFLSPVMTMDGRYLLGQLCGSSHLTSKSSRGAAPISNTPVTDWPLLTSRSWMDLLSPLDFRTCEIRTDGTMTLRRTIFPDKCGILTTHQIITLPTPKGYLPQSVLSTSTLYTHCEVCSSRGPQPCACHPDALEIMGRLGYAPQGFPLAVQAPTQRDEPQDAFDPLRQSEKTDPPGQPVERKDRSLEEQQTASKLRRNKRQMLGLQLYNRNHVCEECGFAFQQKGHLDNHRDSVHRKTRHHKCKFCNKAFGIRSNMNRHINSVHAGEELVRSQPEGEDRGTSASSS